MTALLRVRGRGDAVRAQARAVVQPLLDYLTGPGVGQIPEIFDADPPHAPAGCTAQAWSVAEVVRVLAGEIA